MRGAYPAAVTSTADERDVAAVAVRALVDCGRGGRTHLLTGPEPLTRAAKVPDRLLGSLADYARAPGPASTTVADLLGRPARTFAEWAADHAGAFR